MRKLTVYYDARCGLCCATREWIERQRQLVPVECLPAAEPGAELTVIADTGEIWEGDSAWVVVLWALEDYRRWAIRLSNPSMLAVARAMFAKLSQYRGALSCNLGLEPEYADRMADDKRTTILEAALELFRERGFAESTMREIAARAGVASGLAYYYFDSKDAIVLAFYHRAKDELVPLLEAAQTGKTLRARMQALIEAKFTYFQPNRRFLGALMSHAADPSNPLSPFGEQSKDVREFDFSHFDRALKETGSSVPKDMEPQIAKILWIYQMGLLLFWIYDRSKNQERTHRLLDKSLGLVIALLRLANLPLMRPARRSVLEIVSIVSGD